MVSSLPAIPLIADGALGGLLAEAHRGNSLPPETLNVTDPEAVRALHRAFLAAGATVHRTNTRGAGRGVLDSHGLGDRCEAIHNSGSALVREIVGAEAVVMGVVGQIGPISPNSMPSTPIREKGYGEQMVYLSDTGVTFLALEHFSSLDEMELALRVAQNTSDAPVLAHLRFGAGGKTLEGLEAAEAGSRLIQKGAGALGIGCGTPAAQWPELLEKLLPLGVPVSVMAGTPLDAEGPASRGQPWSATAFAEALAQLGGSGISILGGCCGITPGHVAALVAKLKAQAPGR